MNTRTSSQQAWRKVRSALNQEGGTATARIPSGAIPHPRDAGARPTVTWPVGQVADYAIEGEPGEAPLVVREFNGGLEAAIDGVRLSARVVEVAERNPTAAMYLGGALLGGAVGSAISNKREGTLLGAGLGFLFAALLDGALREDRQR